MQLPKKCLCRRPPKGKNICRFRVVVRVDRKKGFFLDVRKGNVCHTGHIFDVSLLRRIPKRLLDMNENAYLRDCTDTSLSCSVTCNLMFKKTGIMYSLHNIQYIKGMDLSAVERDKIDSDKIIEFLKEKGHKYVSLCHRDVASPESEGTSPLYCIIDEARDEGSLE